MRPFGALTLALLTALLARSSAFADSRPAELGTLETQALEEALAERKLEIDAAPEGKVIGEIHVDNQEVFSRRDGILQLANYIHRTTREGIIRREVLFAPGERFDRELVEETARNLRDPEFSSLVVIVPVKSPKPGTVDVLVVTRDVWSLRFNTDFEFQENRLTYLAASLSENNLFGWRKRASLSFLMNQGAMWVGPTYSDSNIRGTRLTFSTLVGAWFGRDDGKYEGTSSRTVLAYPLYSLARRWGGSLDFSHANYIVRDFLRTRPRVVDLEETPENDQLPWMYRLRRYVFTSSAIRSFGRKHLVQRLSFGHQFLVQRPTFTDGFSDDPIVRQAFARRVFPRSERVSALFTRWSLFTPRYRVYRDFNTFDLREDSVLGPSMDVGVTGAAVPLGSEVDFLRVAGSIGWSFDVLDGFERVGVGYSARLQDGALIDQAYSGGVYIATPLLFRALRVAADAGVAFLRQSRENVYYTLGGDSGLRGYTIGDFQGKAQALAHLEVRSRALPVWSLRLGALVFWDAGHAAESLEALRLHNDAGFGLRLLIPQLNPYVIRVDWAFAMQSSEHTRAGWPGRLSAGFRQAF